MQSFRVGVLRPALIAVCALAVAACSSGGASAPPTTAAASTPAAASDGPSVVASTGATESAAGPSLAPTNAPTDAASSPPAAGGGTGDCPADLTSGHVKYTLGGFEAWHFCGPATATVTLGATTVHISGGSCTTPTAGIYSVAIGTELFGSPPPEVEPDDLIITIASADGVTNPSGVVDHKHWLLIGKAITFGPGNRSGTVSGTTATPGSAVQVSFTC